MEMIIAILLPLIFGAALPFLKIQNRKIKIGFLSAISIVEAALALFIILSPEMSITIWSITNTLTISLRSDGICKLFIAIFAFGWLLVTIFSFKYMQHEENEDRFYSFYLLTEGALIGLSLASNLVTMYICFELATLLSMPLVLHSRTKEAIHAALKYLFYSIAGAFMALLGIFYLSNYSTSLEFTAGGCLSKTLVSGHEGLLLAIIFVTVIGFGAKAGLYPLHAWLPTAHPVAPAPASAVCRRNVGSDCTSHSFAIYRLHGVNEGLPRKGIEKEARLLYDKPNFIYPNRAVLIYTDSIYRRSSSYRRPCSG